MLFVSRERVSAVQQSEGPKVKRFRGSAGPMGRFFSLV
ncbi:hypothetical protein KVC_2660 [Ketogulonicigenium vulgare]|nr:hypothetical protein KVC_2660 [Ketogulonicigenium vulgare]